MYKKILSSALTSIGFLFFASSAIAQMSVTGEVVDVIDGKTVVIAVATGKVKAELQYIDVPETSQKLGQTIKEHLKQLVLGKVVDYRAQSLYKDRTIGCMLLNNTDISMQMLRDGAAWHVPERMSGQEKADVDTYARAEKDAKSEKRGVWGVPGLKPSWETAPEVQMGRVAVKPTFVEARDIPNQKLAAKRGFWGDKNPGLGDVGALSNGYNADSKKGYVGTSFLGVKDADPAKPSDTKMAMAVTYYYTEGSKTKRQGIYVLSVVSVSTKWRFLEHNDLALIANDKPTVIGKPTRTTSNVGGTFQENLYYRIPRAALDKFVNGSDVVLKVGDCKISPEAGLQMLLYNLLQVSN